jgi:hypothetical protein
VCWSASCSALIACGGQQLVEPTLRLCGRDQSPTTDAYGPQSALLNLLIELGAADASPSAKRLNRQEGGWGGMHLDAPNAVGRRYRVEPDLMAARVRVAEVKASCPERSKLTVAPFCRSLM